MCQYFLIDCLKTKIGHSQTLDKYTSALTMEKCEGERKGNAQNFCLHLEVGFFFLGKKKAKESGIFKPYRSHCDGEAIHWNAFT